METSSSGIRDNHHRGTVAAFLKSKIQDGSKMSVVSAYFTIYAYEALKTHLDQIDHLDFLFGEPRFIAGLDPDKTEKKSFILDATGATTPATPHESAFREIIELIHQARQRAFQAVNTELIDRRFGKWEGRKQKTKI